MPLLLVASLATAYKCNTTETEASTEPLVFHIPQDPPTVIGMEQSSGGGKVQELMRNMFSPNPTERVVDALLPEEIPENFNPGEVVTACVRELGGECFSHGGPSIRSCTSLKNTSGTSVWLTDFTPGYRRVHYENPAVATTHVTELPVGEFVFTEDHYDEKDVHPLQSSREELVASLSSTCDLVVSLIERDPYKDPPAACEELVDQSPEACEELIDKLQVDAWEQREDMEIAMSSQEEFSELRGYKYVDPFTFTIDGVRFSWALGEDGFSSVWSYPDEEGRFVPIQYPEDYE